MKTFRLIQIGLVAMLFSSCIQEVSPEGENISGMWAYVNNQSQTASFLEFKDGKMTSYSASGNRTVADGYIWHSSESDFAAAMTWNYSLDVDNLLYLDGKQSGKLVIEGDTMTYGNDKLVSVTGFSPEWYSRITTGITSNIIKANLLEQELEYEFSIVNPIPNSSVEITVSPAGSAGASITTDGKLLIKLEETNVSSTSTILFQYPGAEDLKITLSREASTTISVSKTEWPYDYRSQSVSIPFSLVNPSADAEVKAELTSDVSWIKGLSIDKDDSTVNFTLEENYDSSRSVGVNLSAKGAQNLVLNITQSYSEPQITLSKLSLSLNYEAKNNQSFSYTVSNLRDGGTSTVSCSESWVTNLKDNNGTVTFDVAENNSGSSRTASIDVTYKYGSYSSSKTLVLTQSYSAPVITITPSSLSTDYSAKSLSFGYEVSNPRDGGKSTVSCSESWVTNLKDNNGTVTFDVAENNSGSSRTASIDVTYKYGSYSSSKTLVLTQSYSAPVITITPSSLSTDYSAKSLSFGYEVSNPRDGGKSTVSCSESWVTNLKDNNGTVTFDVADCNSGGAFRTASITLTYKYGSDFIAESIKIYQVAKYVDLGLSVKWASCNLGASKPTEYGGYYQWAGTTDVSDTGIYLDWSNCPYHVGSSSYSSWMKYNTSPLWGTPDNKTVLVAKDDAASVVLGGKWRIPTAEEWTELLNTDNCSWTWTTIDGVNGCKVQSKKPGYTDNWIFLPAAGWRIYDDFDSVGFRGSYWSSSLYTDTPGRAYSMFFSSSSFYRSYDGRYGGNSVRPVSE